MPMKVKQIRPIAIRELYQELEFGDIYRVIYTGLGQDDTYLCKILGERLDIRKYSTARFREMSDSDNPRRSYVPFEPDPFAKAARKTTQTAASEAASRRAWEAISPLAEGFSAGHWNVRWLADKTTRHRTLVVYSNTSGYKLPLLYKLLRRYLQRGMSEEALQSDLANCGAARTNVCFTKAEGEQGPIKSAPIRRSYEKRPGRRPADTAYQYALPSEELERLIEQHLDIYATWRRGVWVLPPAARALGIRLRRTPRDERGLLKVKPKRALRARIPSKDHKPARGRRSKPTFQDLADSVNFLLRRNVEIWDGARLRLLKLNNTNVVTARQIQWRWLKSLPDFVRRRKRHPGEHEVDRRVPEPGRARQHVTAPGQLALIDATVLDIYVVSPLDRRIILGRPVLYLIVDLFSGLIMGLHLGLENPSREAAALALVNMVTKKPEFCAAYGLRITEADWPAHFMPAELAGDRGSEFTSADPWSELARTFGLGVANSPVRTPAARGVGERRFGIVPRVYQKSAFGTVERDFGTRTARRYAWDGIYTVSDVMLMLLRAIDVYHRNPSAGDQPPPVDNAGFADTPLNRWNWGLENAGGTLRAVSPEDMRLAIWPRAKARLYRSGIVFKGAWFKCEPLREEFFDSARSKGVGRSVGIEVQYDPSDMSKILVPLYKYHEIAVIDPNRNAYPLAGVSLADWTEIRAKNRLNRRRQLLEEQARRIVTNHNNQVDEEVAALTQRAALRRSGASHPDATQMKEQRAKQRLMEIEAKKRLSGKQDVVPEGCSVYDEDANRTVVEDAVTAAMYGEELA